MCTWAVHYHCLVVISDEEYEEEHLDWLPVAPEVEEPEEPGWGQLEVGGVKWRVGVLLSRA